MGSNETSIRCPWAVGELYEAYHDLEWGVPLHDERRLFEMLILEGAQAGLSWITVLKKRARYREVFDRFDPEKIARYDDVKVAELLQDPGIIRNRLKIRAAIVNAQATLNLWDEGRTLNELLWSFVGNHPITHDYGTMAEVPTHTPESDRMSAELKRRGFKFVGTTICQALMQAVGMVNDHLVTCSRHDEIKSKNR
jgi:DNA-3-methyladenine glycosylase I